MKRFQRLNQRGDTIVEVLISIAVVSLILGGAYVTTNKSLRAERGAQERIDGTKLVESQIESLKSIAVDDPDALFKNAPTNFCVTPSQQIVAAVAGNNTCRFNASGANNNTKQPAYFISASLSQTSGVNTVTIKNTWAGIEVGSTNDAISMTYRLYQ
jgi:Tfp pilus assembly protein PilV